MHQCLVIERENFVHGHKFLLVTCILFAVKKQKEFSPPQNFESVSSEKKGVC